MNRFFLATSALALGTVLSSGLAQAGSLAPLAEPPVIEAPAAAPMPVMYNWSGAYGGLGLSYGHAEHNSALQQDFWPRGSGVGLGALAGYSWQSGAAVFGIEGHISGDRVRGTTMTGIGEVQSDLRGLASLRGRVGFAADRTLFFATAGAAAGSLRHNAITAGLSETNTIHGAMVGIGIEQAISDGWHVRGDLEHYRFNRRTFDTAGPDSFPDVRTRANVARISTVFRF